MKVMILWFVLLSPDLPGYIEPIEVMAEACSAPSTTPGTLTYDREVNPTRVAWANCAVDVRARSATLAPGVYELATTGLGVPGYEAPDPHTAGPVVIAPEFEQPSTSKPGDKFEWTQDGPSLAAVQAYRYDLEMDGTVTPLPLMFVACVATTGASSFTCTAPIPAVVPGVTHVARIRAADESDPAAVLVSDWSNPLSFIARAVPAKPGNVRIKPGGE